MEALREARLKERNREDGEREAREDVQGKRNGKGWMGDEEVVCLQAQIPGWAGEMLLQALTESSQPPPATLTLMSHTALSFTSSPNPRLLEMRIMTHHANDERFAFLRGRYKDTWSKMKAETSRRKTRPKEEKAMGALVGGYESSDEESTDEPSMPPPLPPPPLSPPPKDEASLEPEFMQMEDRTQAEHVVEDGKVAESAVDEEEKKRLRRQRAEEWKRKRAKGKDVDPGD